MLVGRLQNSLKTGRIRQMTGCCCCSCKELSVINSVVYRVEAPAPDEAIPLTLKNSKIKYAVLKKMVTVL
jgi:hypothetical protein